MACMCGDTACGSCGPAQGYDLAYERLLEEMADAFPWTVDLEDGGLLVEHFGSEPVAEVPASGPAAFSDLVRWLLDRGIAEGLQQAAEATAAERPDCSGLSWKDGSEGRQGRREIGWSSGVRPGPSIIARAYEERQSLLALRASVDPLAEPIQDNRPEWSHAPVCCRAGHRWEATRESRLDKLSPMVCPECGGRWVAIGTAVEEELASQKGGQR